jgi:uncharacterized membrane protein YhaH (DUF805 family)
MRRGGYLSLGIKDIFDPKGRIDRMTYFIYGAILGIIFYVTAYGGQIGFTLLEAALPKEVTEDPGNIYLIALTIAFYAVVFLPSLYGAFCIGAKRLHDIGLPAIRAPIGLLYALGSLVLTDDIPGGAAINGMLYWVWVAFGAAMLFVPGHRGPNRYGETASAPPCPSRRFWKTRFCKTRKHPRRYREGGSAPQQPVYSCRHLGLNLVNRVTGTSLC